MRSIKIVVPLQERDIDSLDWFEYLIVYHDEKDNLLKLAIPDYHNQVINDTFLEDAMASSKISFFRNIGLEQLPNVQEPIIFTLNDGVVESICCNNSKQDCVNSLSYNGRILAKRLK